MEMWLLFFLSLALPALLGRVLPRLLNHGAKSKHLPPGPPAVPIIGNLLWLRHSISEIEDGLREIHARYGPIVTLRVGSRLSIFIADRAIAHTALVAHGAIFSDRPLSQPFALTFATSRILISIAAYGPLWRLLRRNLTAEILHPARIKHFANGRAWVFGVLVDHLRTQAKASAGVVVAVESFQFAMFCLLVLMCFGEKLDENAVRDIEDAQRNFLLYRSKLNILTLAPSVTKYLFRNRVKTALSLRAKQKELYVPLIEARKEFKKRQQQQMITASNEEARFVFSYVDSLLNVELPEEGGRNLSDDEIVALCSEFLNGGTDTTSTALQWIMAELVKHPRIQSKLREEIEGVTRDEKEIKEEDLQRMPYLKSVVMEGLRRHSPAHFVAHAVTEDTNLCGYLIPKEASINFWVSEMNLDGKVWEEPTEFKPERFLGEGAVVDITGRREIKMMPFGAGRRICPGLGLAMLHLEYFVANLVRAFVWEAVEGDEVDMAEKLEFAVVMKNPLRARITSRKTTISDHSDLLNTVT